MIQQRCTSVDLSVKQWGNARTSEVSCERTIFTTLRDIEDVMTVVVKVVIAEWSKEDRRDGFISPTRKRSFYSGDHPSDSELMSP